jgi:hypothetical protein
LVNFRPWEWIVNMGRTDLLGTESKILHRLFICSEHFENHYFKRFRGVQKRRLLTRTAIPLYSRNGCPRCSRIFKQVLMARHAI